VLSIDLAASIKAAMEASHDHRCGADRILREALEILQRKIEAEAWEDMINYKIKHQKKAIKRAGCDETTDTELQNLFKESILNKHAHRSINLKDSQLLHAGNAIAARTKRI